MSWRDKAEKALEAENNRNNRNVSPESGPIDPNVPIVPAVNPKSLLREWRGHLARLDPLRGPDDFDRGEWEQLCRDAIWLLQHHAPTAVLNGWGASGLFGVRVGYPEGGGIAQLLRSCRSVVFDGPRVHVRSYGVTAKRNAACGDGLPLIWELGQ